MNIIKSRVLEIDQFLGISIENTQICNAGTVEGLINTMKKFGEF
jgi:hypothetical protein